MKKKVIFMIINMNVGGTEKALLNMIAEMPKADYDITILMLEKYGGFLESIPSEVNVEYLQEYPTFKEELNQPPKKKALKLIKRGRFIKGILFSTIVLLSKLTKNKSIFFNYLLKNVPELTNEYDVAIAYAGPMDFISYFVAMKINAKKKIQWIHFDITKVGFDNRFAAKLYKQFDKIFVVSKEGKNKFINLFPQFENKVESFPNKVSREIVLKMADEGPGFEGNFNGVRILTVGRLSKEKGQDLAIRALAKLKKAGFNVRWYCIGEGSARAEYQELIKEYEVDNDFILLGAKPNPYPYMKQCDIYVQPSRHEGYCITLAEAKCFNKPIVSTNFTGAREQIVNGKTGVIVNIGETDVYNAIKKMLDNKLLCQRYSESISKEHFEKIVSHY
ncbi:Glycosyltransferase involved in cell wall bisynthesis [Virgibacillus subterraneus]|uniref:Glycosyltransferase involved in cell wall bisynthesis n=1 Tax=Virgibacillus subterraneus TaxID=621109 RepID=A0A1H8ZSE1_9BACI|nr:glycosyltransferase [Virgibacillus subterraneus]SEP67406.1 Glycosyltransferase involved in cell wall bisynthesis [Virgibacillus subterraneus]